MSNEEHRLGDAPVQEAVHDNMIGVMGALDELFNGEHAMPRTKGIPDKRKWGIVVLVFPFGEEPSGRCNFMSNGADRDDLIALFKEMIGKFEAQKQKEKTK